VADRRGEPAGSRPEAAARAADRREEPAGSRPEAAARAVDRCAEPVGRRLAPAEKEAAQAEPRAAFRAPSPSAALAAAWRGRWEVAAPFSAAFRAPSPSAAPAAAWQGRRDAARWAGAQPRAVAHAERLAPRDGAVQVAAPDAEVQAVAAVPDVAVAEVPAAQPWGLAWGLAWGLPSAAAWVFRQVPLLPWPARRPSVPTGRAMARSPTAWPSALWWQARPVVDFSCSFGSSGKKILEGSRVAGDQRISVGPDCGGLRTRKRIYFQRLRCLDASLFMTYSGRHSAAKSDRSSLRRARRKTSSGTRRGGDLK